MHTVRPSSSTGATVMVSKEPKTRNSKKTEHCAHKILPYMAMKTNTILTALFWFATNLEPTLSLVPFVKTINRRNLLSSSTSTSRFAEDGEITEDPLPAATADDGEITGDPLRAATGIRPSLHPTTINALTDALKLRAAGKATLVVCDEVQPIEVAIAASRIAAEAIEKRQFSSEKDGMTFEEAEGQAIAGRVVGVVMRFSQLEELLIEKVSAVGWVKKYGQWNDFGVMEDELDVSNRIKDDPLFAMCRAECLLALFLDTVEAPQMAKIGQAMPDKGLIDFLDEDRRSVLLDSE